MTDLATRGLWSTDPTEPPRSASTVDPTDYLHGHRAQRVVVVAPKAPDDVGTPVEPEWLVMLGDRLQELALAGVGVADWNGHGARPMSLDAVRLSARVMAKLFQGSEGRPFPWIVPTFRGGLQFEWHDERVDLEIDIDPNGSVEVIFTDRVEQKEWDGTLSERESDVLHCLDAIAESGRRL